jgi:putative spermidine/putrescine transport system permease protein
MYSADGSRPWTFYAFAAFFTLFVLFLYGPMTVIYILSFQGPQGGMTFPMNGVSLHWFDALFSQTRVGDIAGSFQRSIGLAVAVALVTVVLSVIAGLGFRRPFRDSLRLLSGDRQPIMPGLFVGPASRHFRLLGLGTNWSPAGRPAHRTLPPRA